MIWRKTTERLPRENVSVLTRNKFGYYGVEHFENGKWRMCTVESVFNMLNFKTYTLDDVNVPEFWAYIDEPNIEGL